MTLVIHWKITGIQFSTTCTPQGEDQLRGRGVHHLALDTEHDIFRMVRLLAYCHQPSSHRVLEVSCFQHLHLKWTFISNRTPGSHSRPLCYPVRCLHPTHADVRSALCSWGKLSCQVTRLKLRHPSDLFRFLCDNTLNMIYFCPIPVWMTVFSQEGNDLTTHLLHENIEMTCPSSDTDLIFSCVYICSPWFPQGQHTAPLCETLTTECFYGSLRR